MFKIPEQPHGPTTTRRLYDISVMVSWAADIDGGVRATRSEAQVEAMER